MGQGDTPIFEGFANTWFEEMLIQWRKSHQSKIRMTLNNYLIPRFGEEEVGRITKASILEFRASLAKVTTRTQTPLSASRINQIMNTLRMILDEACHRQCKTDPLTAI